MKNKWKKLFLKEIIESVYPQNKQRVLWIITSFTSCDHQMVLAACRRKTQKTAVSQHCRGISPSIVLKIYKCLVYMIILIGLESFYLGVMFKTWPNI